MKPYSVTFKTDQQQVNFSLYEDGEIIATAEMKIGSAITRYSFIDIDRSPQNQGTIPEEIVYLNRAVAQYLHDRPVDTVGESGSITIAD